MAIENLDQLWEHGLSMQACIEDIQDYLDTSEDLNLNHRELVELIRDVIEGRREERVFLKNNKLIY